MCLWWRHKTAAVAAARRCPAGVPRAADAAAAQAPLARKALAVKRNFEEIKKKEE